MNLGCRKIARNAKAGHLYDLCASVRGIKYCVRVKDFVSLLSRIALYRRIKATRDR